MLKLLVISGPTATGKTALALQLAKDLNGELISADSRQVYKGMDIGTGKEWGSENNVPIWGYDIVEPNEEWSVAHFVKSANKLIPEIQSRRKLPIIVGGTGLYIANLLNPPETLDIPPDQELRLKLEKLSLPELQGELKHLYEKRFSQMNDSDKRNPRRLIRAIEVVKFTKLHKTASRVSKGQAFLKRPGLIRHIALTAPPDIVDKRIEDRVRQRIEKGAEQEVRELAKKYGWDSALSFTIGYKEWKPYFKSEYSINEVIDLWTTHEKQYVRRQLVWMAKYSPDKLFGISASSHYQDIEAYATRWYHGKE